MSGSRPKRIAGSRRADGFPYSSHGWWRFAAATGSTALVADGAAYGYAASVKVHPAERIGVSRCVACSSMRPASP